MDILRKKNSHSWLNYLELCLFEDTIKSYLNVDIDYNYINIILKFRALNHNLEVVTGIYGNRLIYEERRCELCSNSRVENLHHFMIEFERYQKLRQELATILCHCKSTAEFCKLMNTHIPNNLKSITKFL